MTAYPDPVELNERVRNYQVERNASLATLVASINQRVEDLCGLGKASEDDCINRTDLYRLLHYGPVAPSPASVRAICAELGMLYPDCLLPDELLRTNILDRQVRSAVEAFMRSASRQCGPAGRSDFHSWLRSSKCPDEITSLDDIRRKQFVDLMVIGGYCDNLEEVRLTVQALKQFESMLPDRYENELLILQELAASDQEVRLLVGGWLDDVLSRMKSHRVRVELEQFVVCDAQMHRHLAATVDADHRGQLERRFGEFFSGEPWCAVVKRVRSPHTRRFHVAAQNYMDGTIDFCRYLRNQLTRDSFVVAELEDLLDGHLHEFCDLLRAAVYDEEVTGYSNR